MFFYHELFNFWYLLHLVAMYCIKRTIDFKTIWIFSRFYKIARKSHYEVLNLRRNCTEKEIKDAFIQMSKEFHPDKNKDTKAQEKFVKIVEAYNVLSKPKSRALYDSTCEVGMASHSSYVYRTHAPFDLKNNPNYSFYYNHSRKKKTTGGESKDYYGVKGVKRVPNYYIVLMCFGIALFGTVLQLWIIGKAYKSQRRAAEAKSKALSEELDKVIAAANSSTNEKQTQLILEKIVAAANPAVATAALGQSLASEKKFSEEAVSQEDMDTTYRNSDQAFSINIFPSVVK